MGRSVPLKTPIRFQIANKINGFVHVSYGTALNTNATEKRRCCTDSKRDTYIAQYLLCLMINIRSPIRSITPERFRQANFQSKASW